jgi:hypothetical protein
MPVGLRQLIGTLHGSLGSKLACPHGKGESTDWTPKYGELTIIALVSLFSLGLARAYEADFFAMFFAAAAAIARVEAVRRSL